MRLVLFTLLILLQFPVLSQVNLNVKNNNGSIVVKKVNIDKRKVTVYKLAPKPTVKNDSARLYYCSTTIGNTKPLQYLRQINLDSSSNIDSFQITIILYNYGGLDALNLKDSIFLIQKTGNNEYNYYGYFQGNFAPDLIIFSKTAQEVNYLLRIKKENINNESYIVYKINYTDSTKRLRMFKSILYQEGLKSNVELRNITNDQYIKLKYILNKIGVSYN